jgi:hypothetical protein
VTRPCEGPLRLSDVPLGLTCVRMRRRATTGLAIFVTLCMWCVLGWLIAKGALASCPGQACPGCPVWPLCLRAALVLCLLAITGPAAVHAASLDITVSADGIAAKRLFGSTVRVAARDVTVELATPRSVRGGIIEFRAGRRRYRVARGFSGFSDLMGILERLSRK